jgi:hypothetical protein
MSYGILEQLQRDISELQDINRTLVHGTQVLHDYIATLKAQRDAARQDTERLDAIERHKLDVVCGDASKLWALFAGNAAYPAALTLREAIDAAMAMQDAEEGA